MTRAVLGIDTSCYCTSCALVSDQGTLVSQQRAMLGVPEGSRGLRQNDAVFQHIKRLPDLMDQLFNAAGDIELAAVCASDKPLDGPDSYMPVFAVGLSLARSIAFTHGIPCFTASHQRGHLAAAAFGQAPLPREYLAIHLSGGTTQVLHIDGPECRLLGGTGDISAGQLLDRIGVMMGLPFPAGPAMEALAMEAVALGRYPAIAREGKTSFSGAEAAAIRDLQAGELSHARIAAELFDCIARSLEKLLSHASKQTGVCFTLLTGGVASSALLRRVLIQRIEKRERSIRVAFGQRELSGDNAVGIAAIGLEKYREWRAGQTWQSS